MSRPRARASEHVRFTVSEWGSRSIDVEPTDRHYGYLTVDLDVGNRGIERVVPPAGDDYAFDAQQWARRISVSVSPTGRSVRVFVDGNEVPAP